MIDLNISALPTLKIDLLDHIFIKDEIFEAIVHFTPRVTPIGIIVHHCDHHNI